MLRAKVFTGVSAENLQSKLDAWLDETNIDSVRRTLHSIHQSSAPAGKASDKGHFANHCITVWYYESQEQTRF